METAKHLAKTIQKLREATSEFDKSNVFTEAGESLSYFNSRIQNLVCEIQEKIIEILVDDEN